MAQSQRLTSQVTLRLDQDLADRLRDLADKRGMKYTSLLRHWIETMYDAEVAPVIVKVQLEEGGQSGEPHGRNMVFDAMELAEAS